MTDTLESLDSLESLDRSDSLDTFRAVEQLDAGSADIVAGSTSSTGTTSSSGATSSTGTSGRPFIGAGLATVDLVVMGRRGHLVVHTPTGADAAPMLGERLLEHGVARLRELEQRWSPYIPTSDVSRVNTAAGSPVSVHPDTIRAVTRALDGWHRTDGRFDVTTRRAAIPHAAIQHAAPHMPAPHMASAPRVPPAPGGRAGTSAQVIVDPARSTITVPAGSAIDLGGIDKGLAADLVADELMAAGATGVLVNLGGDLTMRGVPDDDTSWYLGIDDPSVGPKHVALVRVGAGGVATSRTPVGALLADGAVRQDPNDSSETGAGAVTRSATVLAADAATADVFATVAMTWAPAEAAAMLDELGLAGLIVAADGSVHRTSTLRAFLA